MLLLPLHFIKDAAKSVKRICLDHFKIAEGSLLTELLGISALIVTVYNITREGEHDVLHLWCNHRSQMAVIVVLLKRIARFIVKVTLAFRGKVESNKSPPRRIFIPGPKAKKVILNLIQRE